MDYHTDDYHLFGIISSSPDRKGKDRKSKFEIIIAYFRKREWENLLLGAIAIISGIASNIAYQDSFFYWSAFFYLNIFLLFVGFLIVFGLLDIYQQSKLTKFSTMFYFLIVFILGLISMVYYMGIFMKIIVWEDPIGQSVSILLPLFFLFLLKKNPYYFDHQMSFNEIKVFLYMSIFIIIVMIPTFVCSIYWSQYWVAIIALFLIFILGTKITAGAES